MPSAWRMAIEDAVTPGVACRPPVAGITYVEFVVHFRDPSLVTVAIAHPECRKVVLDLIEENLAVPNCVCSQWDA